MDTMAGKEKIVQTQDGWISQRWSKTEQTHRKMLCVLEMHNFGTYAFQQLEERAIEPRIIIQQTKRATWRVVVHYTEDRKLLEHFVLNSSFWNSVIVGASHNTHFM